MAIIEFHIGNTIPWIVATSCLAIFVLEVLFVTYLGPSLKRIHGNVWSAKSPSTGLSYSPTSVGKVDLVAIVVRLLMKYVPGYRTDLETRKEKDGYNLPPISLEGPFRLSPQDFAAFLPAMKLEKSFKFDSEAAAKNEFLLISLTTPLLLVLLSHPRCPIKPLGAVNTRNRFTFHDPALLRDTTRLLEAAEARKLSTKTEMGGSDNYGRRTRRGIEFNVRITVLHDGQPLLTQDLSFLQFLPKSQMPLYLEAPENVKKSKLCFPTPEDAAMALEVDIQAPIRWAASCKDYNPIHVSKLLAKVFGFPSTIAHGNHVTALVVQRLYEDSSRSPKENASAAERNAYEMCWNASRPTWLEVTFQKPMTLPISLGVQWQSDDAGGVEFVISSHGRVHVVGKIGYL